MAQQWLGLQDFYLQQIHHVHLYHAHEQHAQEYVREQNVAVFELDERLQVKRCHAGQL